MTDSYDFQRWLAQLPAGFVDYLYNVWEFNMTHGDALNQKLRADLEKVTTVDEIVVGFIQADQFKKSPVQLFEVTELGNSLGLSPAQMKQLLAIKIRR